MSSKSCEFSNDKKYLKRKSPPISAAACPLGMIETGNDGNKWEIVRAGKSQRWVLCGTKGANCDGTTASKFNKNSKKVGKNKQIIKVTGTITYNRYDETESSERDPTINEIYKHFKRKNYLSSFIENISGIQSLYDEIKTINLTTKLKLEYHLINYENGKNREGREIEFGNNFPSLGEVKKEVIRGTEVLYECYGGQWPSECLYVDSKGELLGEFMFENIKLEEISNNLKSKIIKKTNKVNKTINKKCAEGKVLNPKTGRCVNDKTKSKSVLVPNVTQKFTEKKCPEGKVLNPKTGRCVKDKSKSKSVLVSKISKTNKKCVEGKILNPKTGRCVKSISKTSSKKNKKKVTKGCPKGKVLNKKTNRCVKDKKIKKVIVCNNNKCYKK